MAKPHKPRRQQPRLDPQRRDRPARPDEMVELVDPAWILKALGLALGVALVCGYVTICIVFARSQWQLALQPAHTVTSNPAALGLAFQEVHFDTAGNAAGASAGPVAAPLDGWWLPAATPTAPTALVLHAGEGTLADALPHAQALHDAGLAVLLFDYRGFGRSADPLPDHHPSQASMQVDADAAFAYLVRTRALAPRSIVVYGTGVGASLAVALCAQHPELPALILESPSGDLRAGAVAENHSHLIPVGLLFHEDFPLATPLRTLPTPKLLISYTLGAPPPALQQAADPKMTVELAPASPTASAPGPALHEALLRFLAAYL